MCWLRSCRAEPGPRQGAEPRAAVQGVRRHQQREALRHLRLQRLQRLLQAQCPQEAHLQVGTGVGGSPWGRDQGGMSSQWGKDLGMGTQQGKDPGDGHPVGQGLVGQAPSGSGTRETGTHQGRDQGDVNPVGQGPQGMGTQRDRDLGDENPVGQRLGGQAPSGVGTHGMDTQQGRGPRAWATSGAGTRGWTLHRAGTRGQVPSEAETLGEVQGTHGARTAIKAVYSLGQCTHGEDRAPTGDRAFIGTGDPLGTGCPSWRGTHCGGTRHPTGTKHLQDMAPMAGQLHPRDRGHPRGCSLVPPLPIGAKRGQGCARWTRRTATSARLAG